MTNEGDGQNHEPSTVNMQERVPGVEESMVGIQECE